MSVEVGVGYVSVVPEARGFGRRLERQIVGEAANAGTVAGRQSGRGFLSGLGGAVKVGAAGVAAGAGALFAAGFAQAVEQDKSNAKLGAQLGLSEKESARAGKVAGSVYAKGYGESIDQVNDSLKALAQNGVASINAPKKELAGLSKAALNLAETFDADVGESAKAVGQLIRTGLVKDGKAGFDLLTAGFQSGADKAGDLIDTVNEYSTQWRKAGLDGATAIGLINQALQAGARDGDVAADAIKEFSIRAVDGSKTTADGWKALGLNADDMAAKFAKGGKAANGVLDLTLDRLRGIKDPVLQSQIAVQLFGTQAEDLGSALLAMDPSSAAKGLGEVGGAADKMGKTLHNTASNQIEVFKRQALQGLADFADKYALPALKSFGGFLNEYVLPPAQTVGGALVNVLVPAARGVGDAFAGGVQWVREYGAWLIPLGVAIGGIAITAGISTIATWGMTAAFSAYRAVILTATAVTRGFAIAQGIVNAVMRANPVGLIITGVLALGAALVVAYNKSDRFRAIVQAAWSGIKAGWAVLWNSALKPGLGYLMAGLRAVGTAASWLWSNVLSPVFSFIGTAAKVMFAIVAVAVIAPLVISFRALGAVASWLWSAAIEPAFRGIAAVGQWLLNSIIKPVISGAMAAFRALGAAGSWLYNSAIKPAMRGIGTVVSWLYTSIIKPNLDFAKAAIRGLGTVGTWLYRSAIKPAFEGIGAVASWLWTKGLKPALDAGKKGVGLFAGAFETARDGIELAWKKVKSIAAEPVNFIIKWVYSRGIKAVWDKVADFVGLDKLPSAPKLLAQGGTVGNGWSPAEPMRVSKPTAIVGEGNPRHPEFVIPTDPKYRPRARSLWQAAGTQLMADGGVIGTATDFITNPGKAWSAATGWIREKITQIGSSRWAQVLAKVPTKMLGALKDKVVNGVKNLFSGLVTRKAKGLEKFAEQFMFGKNVTRWAPVVLQALRLAGQPASLLPVVLRRMNQESGGNPHAINKWDINAKRGDPSRGLMQTIGATFNHYAGKLRSRGIYDPLANVYASLKYALATYGSVSRAYNRPGGYANGGRPKRGELAWVGERGPELIRFGGGDTEVYDHKTSLGMAAGLTARGFAKGTSAAKVRAKARGELPGDIRSFSKSLTGSASDIARAAKSLAEDLKAAGGAGRRLASSTNATSAKLQALAKRRDALSGRIDAARQTATDQKKTAADYLGLGNLAEANGVSGVIAGLQTRQGTLKSFQSDIVALQKRGLSQDLIGQLVAMGPESTLAHQLRGASAGQIGRLNKLAKSGAKLSASYGNSMADAMYDSGKQAGRGFLAGLKAQEAELQAQMDKLGAGLVKSIKKSLKIKSPSRVMRDQVGAQVGAGVVVGMTRTLPAVASAASRMADVATSAAVVPVTTAQRPAGQSPGLQPGQRLRLVVNGAEFDAYVDDRVDEGLADVRRRARAGAK
ncbi:phage tail tape measure protein [Streptomyces violaceusniger]|uniref:phage tail tape measure protein n=1 Tax=Streptomyces violaceusniger TaxID=68280 RepID=UPI000998E5C6|nr:phage tail tape measure protein [Streptomyces hygroscopicus]AQW55299.1 hypothetical protein SHXM_08762 [Streptomyces hygroscopicus]